MKRVLIIDDECFKEEESIRTGSEKAKFLKIHEGLCVQCLHIGSYDDEPKTLELIDNFIEDNKLQKDLSETRRHHEIYLSNPLKTEVEKLKTVLRIPVRK